MQPTPPAFMGKYHVLMRAAGRREGDEWRVTLPGCSQGRRQWFGCKVLHSEETLQECVQTKR